MPGPEAVVLEAPAYRCRRSVTFLAPVGLSVTFSITRLPVRSFFRNAVRAFLESLSVTSSPRTGGLHGRSGLESIEDQRSELAGQRRPVKAGDGVNRAPSSSLSAPRLTAVLLFGSRTFELAGVRDADLLRELGRVLEDPSPPLGVAEAPHVSSARPGILLNCVGV